MIQTDVETMVINVDVTYAIKPSRAPDKRLFARWAQKTLENIKRDIILSIHVVDENEGKELNRRWRKIESATNVLSFPAGETEAINHGLLGDIAICAPVIEREAEMQDKTVEAHYAHMTVHGVLHLIGYDHQTADDADKMESMETRILGDLGYPDPYK